ncbi:MAG TPA: hypothetical protein VME44_14725, partial [Streptosporangiaceae bacterium]|nr:hypothetical protein [Streptosporangiaceae bacterium]
MNGTALDHHLVRDYLAELDAAMRGLPPAQARELKEQIKAHLDEALPPDADDGQVHAALARLGSAPELAAEASAVAGVAGPAAPVSGLWGRLARVRRRTWVIAGLIVILIAGAAKYVDYYLSVDPLEYSNGGDWWYAQDVKHQDIASTYTATQNTTRIRSGQRQGYLISIYNPTNFTQTIVGDGSGPTVGYNAPWGKDEQVAVSRSYTDIANGFTGESAARRIPFTLPVSIPPFQTRLVRVLWTSESCLSNGESTGINQIFLRVRVGWFTRTEKIPQQGWYLAGPSHGRCG